MKFKENKLIGGLTTHTYARRIIFARICVKATPSSNTFPVRLFESPSGKAALRALSATDVISRQPPDLP